jgi:hypothetical protein
MSLAQALESFKASLGRGDLNGAETELGRLKVSFKRISAQETSTCAHLLCLVPSFLIGDAHRVGLAPAFVCGLPDGGS